MANALSAFHPILAQWFTEAFGDPTDVQHRSWEAIRSGRHTLIAAPTGSGKTLAALLPCIDYAVRLKQSGASSGSGGVRVLYVTPLKALNNDIHHHVLGFAEAIERIASESGADWHGLRAAVRTGDTTPSQRASMLKRPPDMLITTPESLYILLTSDKGRRMLQTVRKVIVDEIHELAADKRGAHLSLSLERLTALCAGHVQRIGVSATLKPLERVARYLAGWEEDPADNENATGSDRHAASPALPPFTAAGGVAPVMPAVPKSDGIGATSPASPASPASPDSSDSVDASQSSETQAIPAIPLMPPPDAVPPQDIASHPLGFRPRPVAIVESAMTKRIELTVTMPDRGKPVQTRDSVWFPVMDRILQLMEGCRSVLIFVNSRRLCERLTLRLNDYVGYEMAKSHHGSVARQRRLEVERELKEGGLRAIVATSSLELGIDVGHVDLVLQLDSPIEAAAGIQRIGRAGHAVGDVSRGAILARARGALPEIAVLSKLISAREIEEIRLPRNPLDVLSQHMVAMAATGDWDARELHKLVCRSDSFRTFAYDRLLATLRVLGGYYPFARPLLNYDGETGSIGKRSNSSMAAVTGAGTIPQSSDYQVHHADSRVHLGELDEEFIQESRVGDVFQLGTSSWMIQHIQKDRVYVTEAGNRYSEIPFWRNESGGRSYELGRQVGLFWDELQRRLGTADDEGARTAADRTASEWLAHEFKLDALAGQTLIDYVRSQMAVSDVPTANRLVVEHYRDVTNRVHVILHNYWGKRVNRTWLIAIEKQWKDILPYRIYGNAKDYGIEFVLPEWDPSWLQAVWRVTPANVDRLLAEAVPGSPLLAVAFRRIAETSLLLSRSFTRTPMWQKRIRSEELLRASLPHSEHFPYLQEAVKECLYDYLDVDRLKDALQTIASGETQLIVRETDRPSPLASQYIADYANMQLYEGNGLDDAVQLQLLHVSKELTGELFGEETVRRAIDPGVVEEERLRLMQSERRPRDASELYLLLKKRGDSTTEELSRLAGEDRVPVWLDELERGGRVRAVRFGDERRWICRDELDMYERFPATEASVAFVAGRYAEHVLSFTEEELRLRYPVLSEREARRVTEELLRRERIEQAPFAASAEERIWTSRKVASRIIRLSVQQARSRAEPVEPSRWLGQMASMQHALKGAQLAGSGGLRAAIGKLQGFFLPLSLWESVVFPARVADYRKEELDLLCASGEVIWIGRKEEGEKEGKIAFFLSEFKPLYAPFLREAGRTAGKHPELLERLKRGGASFLTKLAGESGRLPSELLSDLLDLAWEGLVSNDQFAPLRIQAQTKGRHLARTGSGQGRWYWIGSLEETPPSDTAAETAGAAEQSAMEWTRHLLGSCGILTKDLVDAVSPYNWDSLLPVVRKLEQWGVVTRGLFIRGVHTMQFVSRDLVDGVRQPLRPGGDAAAVTVLSAVDPANPFGLVAPWPEAKGDGVSFARKPVNYLVLHGGRWLLWLEGGGKRIHLMDPEAERTQEPDLPKLLREVFRTIMRQNGASKIKIELWNGEAAAESPEGAPLLRSLGAERDRNALVLWVSSL